MAQLKSQDASPRAKMLLVAAAKLASPSGQGGAMPAATPFAPLCWSKPLGGRKCPAFTAATQGLCPMVNDFLTIIMVDCDWYDSGNVKYNTRVMIIVIDSIDI